MARSRLVLIRLPELPEIERPMDAPPTHHLPTEFTVDQLTRPVQATGRRELDEILTVLVTNWQLLTGYWCGFHIDSYLEHQARAENMLLNFIAWKKLDPSYIRWINSFKELAELGFIAIEDGILYPTSTLIDHLNAHHR